MPDDRNRRPEQPRSEPEIIPPGQRIRPRGAPEGAWAGMDDDDGIHRIYVRRFGLPTVIFALMVVGLVVSGAFLLLAGVVLIWLPIVVLGIVLAVLAGYTRYYWRRFQVWLAGRPR